MDVLYNMKTRGRERRMINERIGDSSMGESRYSCSQNKTLITYNTLPTT